jgi:hypothetical protein
LISPLLSFLLPSPGFSGLLFFSGSLLIYLSLSSLLTISGWKFVETEKRLNVAPGWLRITEAVRRAWFERAETPAALGAGVPLIGRLRSNKAAARRKRIGIASSRALEALENDREENVARKNALSEGAGWGGAAKPRIKKTLVRPKKSPVR